MRELIAKDTEVSACVYEFECTVHVGAVLTQMCCDTGTGRGHGDGDRAARKFSRNRQPPLSRRLLHNHLNPELAQTKHTTN